MSMASLESFFPDPNRKNDQINNLSPGQIVGHRAILAVETSMPFSLREGTLLEAFKRGNARNDQVTPQAERFFRDNEDGPPLQSKNT